jgi:HAD superfamily hydrolase (TIGR01509 family)
MLKALLFDVDGTLADTDPVHVQAFALYLAPHGLSVDETFYRTRISGRANAAIFADLFPNRSPEEHARFGDEKEALYRELARELAPLRGLPRLLDWARSCGLRLAAVTNGPRVNLEHALEGLGIEGRFEVLIAREDVARAKPDPLPYATALQRLGLGPAEAVAFEDSPAGVTAAMAAGLFTVGLLTSQPAGALREAGADVTIADFDDPALWRVLRERAGR